jgi:hypothetical protein
MVVHICNSNTWDAEAGGWQGNSRLAWPTYTDLVSNTTIKKHQTKTKISPKTLLCITT